MENLIRLSRSVIGEKEIDAVNRILKIGFLGMGKEVGEFEDELANFINGNVEVVCVNTGTSALHLALQACNIGRGDEVLVPTLTYVSSFQAISATGATPVAVDVLLNHGGIDPVDAERRLTSKTKAIMPVHYASNFGEYDAIYNLARKYNLRVIEDAAHSFGCKLNQKRCGSFGDIVCFSFDGIKNITSGEGGAVVSKDKEIIQKVRDSRLLGVLNDTQKRLVGERSTEFDVINQGWRYHMSEIMAAIGRVQLSRFEEFAEKRIILAKNYQRYLSSIKGIDFFDINYGQIVPHIFVALLDHEKRDKLRFALKKNGIGFGLHYMPNHLLSLYKGKQNFLINLFKQKQYYFPNAEMLYKKMITLPLHPLITNQQQEKIISIVSETLEDD